MAFQLPSVCHKMLAELGLILPHCSNVELHLPAHGAVTLHYDVYVTGEQLDKLALVLQAMASELRPKQDGEAQSPRTTSD